jgi:hypothetical protein
MFRNTKNGQIGSGDLTKFELGRKTQTYHSDLEEQAANSIYSG